MNMNKLLNRKKEKCASTEIPPPTGSRRWYEIFSEVERKGHAAKMKRNRRSNSETIFRDVEERSERVEQNYTAALKNVMEKSSDLNILLWERNDNLQKQVIDLQKQINGALLKIAKLERRIRDFEKSAFKVEKSEGM